MLRNLLYDFSWVHIWWVWRAIACNWHYLPSCPVDVEETMLEKTTLFKCFNTGSGRVLDQLAVSFSSTWRKILYYGCSAWTPHHNDAREKKGQVSRPLSYLCTITNKRTVTRTCRMRTEAVMVAQHDDNMLALPLISHQSTAFYHAVSVKLHQKRMLLLWLIPRLSGHWLLVDGSIWAG